MAFINQEKKAKVAPEIHSVLKKYGMKGSIAVRHHSTLVVNLKSGPIDFGREESVNVYHIDKNYDGRARAFLVELLEAMKGEHWFDRSDFMTDYHCVSYYNEINIGKWNKPYILTK